MNIYECYECLRDIHWILNIGAYLKAEAETMMIINCNTSWALPTLPCQTPKASSWHRCDQCWIKWVNVQGSPAKIIMLHTNGAFGGWVSMMFSEFSRRFSGSILVNAEVRELWKKPNPWWHLAVLGVFESLRKLNESGLSQWKWIYFNHDGGHPHAKLHLFC